MTVVLDDKLVQRAASKLRANGEDDAEARELADSLEGALESVKRRQLSPEEFSAALKELADYHESVADPNRTPLPDYATARAGIYAEDGGASAFR